MPVRREADPASVQHVWDAIRSANAQKQMADQQRIVKYLQRVDECSQAQAELYLQQTLNDGLVVEMHKLTVKGMNIGAEVDSYKLPMQELPEPKIDGKDWYCIDCHLAGDVLPCRFCHRVFHAECSHKKKISNRSFYNFYRNPTPQEKETDGNAPNCKEPIVIEDDENKINEIQNNSSLFNEESSLIQLVDDVERKLAELNAETVAPTVENEKLPELDEQESYRNDFIPSSSEPSGVYDETLCSVCNIFRLDPDLDVDKAELNHLLSFVQTRIKSWVPASITDRVPAESKPEWLLEPEIDWRAKQLFYIPLNMTVIESKLQTGEYVHSSQFKADVLTVRHNIAIYHGLESQEFDCAEYLWKDCDREIAEMAICIDCYRHSNEKINSKWFCLPCRSPHKLVWAKQKGYPYWPAKVIQETDDNCDVRFFGAKYERAILTKNYIKPITANMKQAGKKNAALVKAIDELELHQRLLKNPDEVQRYLENSPKKRKSVKPIKLPVKKQKFDPKQRSQSLDLMNDDEEFVSFKESNSKMRASTDSYLNTKVNNHNKPLPPTNFLDASETSTQNTSVNGTNKQDSVIDVSSDFEEQMAPFEDEFGKSYDGGHQEVSSSTEQVHDEAFTKENSERSMPQTERQYSEAVEKTRRKMEQCHDKKDLIQVALECMQTEIDTIKGAHDEYIKRVFELHNAQVSETKKKQWCYNCEQDAIYHCCWNTAYCSPSCQQQHWQAEHRKVCRRKR